MWFSVMLGLGSIWMCKLILGTEDERDTGELLHDDFKKQRILRLTKL